MIDETVIEKVYAETDEVQINENKVDKVDNKVYHLRDTSGRNRSIVYTPNREKVITNSWGRGGKPRSVEITLSEIIEAVAFEQAIESPQRNEWKVAMDEELSSLESRDTCEIVNRTEDIKCISSKWVYKIKTDPTGKVIKFKARLVAQGYNEKKDVNYFESYGPVANISTIRLLLAMSVSQGWKVYHLDVKSAYLYGDRSYRRDIYEITSRVRCIRNKSSYIKGNRFMV